MDSPGWTEYEPFNYHTDQGQLYSEHTDPNQLYTGHTDPNQLYTGHTEQMGSEQGPPPSAQSDPYLQIYPGNASLQSASTADLISQGSHIVPASYLRPKTLKIHSQRQNKVVKCRDSRKLTVRKDSESTDDSELGIDRQCVSKCSLYILVALTLLALVFAGGSVIMVLKLMATCDELKQELSFAHASYTFAQQDAHTCLPCGEITQGPFEEDNGNLQELIKKRENGVPICCAKTAAQLSVMLNLFMKRKQLERCAHESLMKENLTSCITSQAGSLPPRINGSISAHLVAGDSHTGKDDDYQPIRNWRQGKPGTHLSNVNITAENSRIVIPETGLYFLYSQVGYLVYYDKQQTTEQNASQSLFHVVYRYNAIYPLDGSEELLRSVVTQCWEKEKDYGRYTSYVGAAVRLNKGDQLYVKVSKIQDVYKGASMTYFGLFKFN